MTTDKIANRRDLAKARAYRMKRYADQIAGTAPRNEADWARCAGPCGGWVRWNKGTSKPKGEATCNPCRRLAVPESKACPVCATQFVPLPYYVDKVRKFTASCSYTCGVLLRYGQTEIQGDQARNATKGAKRRIRLVGQTVEHVDPAVVYNRDGWVCQLCSEPVDPTLTGCAPESPSLDHVIPLSVGGEHSYANTQLAHFGCNSRKNNGGGNAEYVDGYWVLGPKPPRRCDCGQFMTRLKTAWRCYSCRPLKQGGADVEPRAERALSLRSEGWTWTSIAVTLGYENQNKARQAATYYARKRGADTVTRKYVRADA